MQVHFQHQARALVLSRVMKYVGLYTALSVYTTIKTEISFCKNQQHIASYRFTLQFSWY